MVACMSKEELKQNILRELHVKCTQISSDLIYLNRIIFKIIRRLKLL